MPSTSSQITTLNLITSICVLVLWFKYFAVVVMGHNNSQTNDSTVKDDEKLITDNKTNTSNADEKRWWYIALNDLENIPIALILYYGAYLSVLGNSEGLLALMILLPIFTLSRIIHSFAFAKSMLYLRGGCHFISLACIISFGLTAIIGNFV